MLRIRSYNAIEAMDFEPRDSANRCTERQLPCSHPGVIAWWQSAHYVAGRRMRALCGLRFWTAPATKATVLPIWQVGPKKIAFTRPWLHFSDPPWVKVSLGERFFLRGYTDTK